MSQSQKHIAICDDEPDLREMVGEYLSKRGYRVSLCDGAAALDALIAEGPADALILDINMPEEDGLSILHRLRAELTMPVLMLTAVGEVIDKIVGLEMGADDYLSKPVDLRELEARLKAVLRRAEPKPKKLDKAPSEEKIEFDGLVLDLVAASIQGRNGEAIPLTAMEFRLLNVFVERRGRVLNRDQLLELAHDRGWDPFDRSIDIRISRLRRKIERNPAKPALIRTVRGLGYVFDPG